MAGAQRLGSGRVGTGVLLGVDGDGRWIDAGAMPGTGSGQATRLPGPVLPGVVNAHSHAFQRAIVGLTERRDPRARRTTSGLARPHVRRSQQHHAGEQLQKPSPPALW